MYVLDKITNWSDLLQCRRIDLVRGGGGVVLFNLCQRLIDWFGGPPFLPPRVRLGKGLCLSGVLCNTELCKTLQSMLNVKLSQQRF